MMDKIDILNIKIDRVDIQEAENRVRDFIESGKNSHIVVTPNSEMVVRAQSDSELAAVLNNADLAVPDGAGIVLASRLLSDKKLTQRVAGFDLMERLFSTAVNEGYSIYLLGGEPGIADRASAAIRNDFPGIEICGFHHGYLDQQEQQAVIKDINSYQPDLLFVGMGVPLQEKFLQKNKNDLAVGIGMTVGGSFDVLAGKTERAPVWMQKAYLEWLFRLLKEPSRLSRMIALPHFVLMVFREFLFNNKN